MKNPIDDLRRYRKFLESIPLDRYREELKNVKWVEQDLPKEILPLSSIFKYYWEEREFLDFEEWFEKFWEEINTYPESRKALEDFKRYFSIGRLRKMVGLKRDLKQECIGPEYLFSLN